MTNQQIDWAATHDWFLFARKHDFGSDMVAVCQDVCAHRNGTITREQVEFSNFRELREWAGY